MADYKRGDTASWDAEQVRRSEQPRQVSRKSRKRKKKNVGEKGSADYSLQEHFKKNQGGAFPTGHAEKRNHYWKVCKTNPEKWHRLWNCIFNCGKKKTQCRKEGKFSHCRPPLTEGKP